MFDFETQVLLLTVERLNSTQLYTGAEAAATRYDPVRQARQYRRLGKRVWNLTRRGNDPIWEWPDNCETNENGYPLTEHIYRKSRRKLLPGHDHPRWQGNTLQSTLKADEQQFLHINRLINTLSHRACALIDAEDDPAPRAQEGAAKMPKEETRVAMLEVVPVVFSEIPATPLSRPTPRLTRRQLMLVAIAALCLWFSQPIQNRSEVPESYHLAIDDYLKRTRFPPAFGHSPPMVFSQLSQSWKESRKPASR